MRYEKGSCSPFVAAAIYDRDRHPGQAVSELTLVLDLDRGAVGLCRCDSDGLAQLLWQWEGIRLKDYFTTVAGILANQGEASAVGEAMHQAAPGWKRMLRSYLRYGADRPLPVEGCSVLPTVLCSQVETLFRAQWRGPIEQMLKEAKAQLSAQFPEETPWILPMGRLAGFYPAEQLIFDHFAADPLLQVMPNLASYAAQERAGDMVTQGTQLYQQRMKARQVLKETWSLVLQCRQEDTVIPNHVTLAQEGTPHEQLRRVSYGQPVYLSPKEALTVSAGGKTFSVMPPAGLFGGKAGVLARIGLILEGERFALSILAEGSSQALSVTITE